jgi:hypothetical protein
MSTAIFQDTCTRKERLTAQIRATMDEIIALEIHASSDRKLDHARKRKDTLLQQYAEHVQAHGCGIAGPTVQGAAGRSNAVSLAGSFPR